MLDKSMIVSLETELLLKQTKFPLPMNSIIWSRLVLYASYNRAAFLFFSSLCFTNWTELHQSIEGDKTREVLKNSYIYVPYQNCPFSLQHLVSHTCNTPQQQKGKNTLTSQFLVIELNSVLVKPIESAMVREQHFLPIWQLKELFHAYVQAQLTVHTSFSYRNGWKIVRFSFGKKKGTLTQAETLPNKLTKPRLCETMMTVCG